MSIKISMKKLTSVIERGIIPISFGEKSDGNEFMDFASLNIENDFIKIKSVCSAIGAESHVKIDSDELVESRIDHCINFVKLIAMLSSMPKDEFVEISFDDKNADDFVGNLIFKCGKSKWKMPCLDKNLVPDIKINGGEEVFSIDRDIFISCMDSVSFAGNQNDPDFLNSNICVSSRGNKIFFGSTDDIRCAIKVIDNPLGVISARILLPIKFTKKIVKSFEKGDVKFFLGNGFVRMEQDGYSVRVSLPCEADVNHFPQFEMLSEKKFSFTVRVMNEELKNIIKACFQVNKEEFLLKSDNENIFFYALDKHSGIVYKSSVPYAGDKIDISIGVCSMFLLDYLKKNTDDIIDFSFDENTGKPKMFKINNESNCSYIMKSLVDLVNMPDK